MVTITSYHCGILFDYTIGNKPRYLFFLHDCLTHRCINWNLFRSKKFHSQRSSALDQHPFVEFVGFFVDLSLQNVCHVVQTTTKHDRSFQQEKKRKNQQSISALNTLIAYLDKPKN